MAPDEQLYKMLEEADNSDLIGLSRYLCEKILEIDPNNARVLTNYACQEISLGQYDAAMKALDRAEKYAPQDKLKFVLSQRGQLLEHMGNFAEAENVFLKAHYLDPADATFLIFAGSAAFRSGNIKSAEKLARQAILCEEGCIDEAYFNLGGYLLSQRKYSEAQKCYKKSLELDPDYDLAKKRLEDVEKIIALRKEKGKGAASSNFKKK
jgi:tetratricopeptide (TPR) repeat protein